MGCQAVGESRESKIIEQEYKQESFELSPNIDKYKNSLQVLYNKGVAFKITQCFVNAIQVHLSTLIAVNQLYQCIKGKVTYNVHD